MPALGSLCLLDFGKGDGKQMVSFSSNIHMNTNTDANTDTNLDTNTDTNTDTLIQVH